MDKIETNAPRSVTEPVTNSMGLPVTAETMIQAMKEIGININPDHWLLVDPYGRMFRGTVEEVMLVVAAEHPMLKIRAPDWLHIKDS